jgi:hypothetical protein
MPGNPLPADFSGYIGRISLVDLGRFVFVEDLHAPSVYFFHQEKCFQDLLPSWKISCCYPHWDVDTEREALKAAEHAEAMANPRPAPSVGCGRFCAR